jgi:hypothetical protein
MKSAMEQLNKEWNDIAQKMYAKTGDTGGAGAQQQQGPMGGDSGSAKRESKSGKGKKDKEEVQDADFEVVDDKEKKN